VALDAEFHRTRTAPGPGWFVLATIHNPHAEPVRPARLRVRLLDAEGEEVGGARGSLERGLAPGERAPIAVLIDHPVPHEDIELLATGPTVEALPEPAALSLEHDDPIRGELGGWVVFGRVRNPGEAPVEGARVEVQALDGSGLLLGLDWLVLDPIEAGEAVEFELGELRYDEVPASFALVARSPAKDPSR
jgi:hypothetical protein